MRTVLGALEPIPTMRELSIDLPGTAADAIERSAANLLLLLLLLPPLRAHVAGNLGATKALKLIIKVWQYRVRCTGKEKR